MASESDHGNSSMNKNARLRRRGIYTLKKIDKLTRNGQKISMRWNTKGQPIGPYRSIFQHYIGIQTRSRVSISISKWKDVPKEVKSLICEAVMEKFDVDESKMRLILLSASKKWSDFKHILTTYHLFTNTERTQIRTEPPVDFPFIGRDTWAEFIQQRCSSEFQEISDRNSKSAKLNDYPFRSARKSYASIEEELLIEQGLDPTTSSLPRHELWLAARKCADDVYEPRVMDVARNIDTLKEKAAQGQILLEGREDILSVALGKEDHSGRVRAVGAGVGVKTYFPNDKQRNLNNASQKRINELQEEMEILKQENAARDQMMEQLKTQLEFFQKKWNETHVEEPHVKESHVQESSPHSDNDRCSKTYSPHIEEQIPTERWEKCSLFWPNLSSKVAEGRVLVPPQGKVTMLHCQPLKPDRVKVLVDDLILPNVNVPFPTEEVNVVFEAKGTPVAWPKDLVVVISAQNQNVNVTTSPSRNGKQVDKDLCQPSQNVRSLEKYRVTCPSFPSNFVITLDVGEDLFNLEHQLHVEKEHIQAWIQKNALVDIHVAFYMKYLNERRSSSHYGFLCPVYLADDCKSEEEKARYMANCMSKPERKKCVWFAPYKDGFHWALAVINPWDNIVYLLDPLRKGVPGNKFKDMVHAAIAIFVAQQNRFSRRKTHWLNIYCPKQENASDSGYYVCRYMREIIDHECTVIPVNYFRDSPTCYDMDSIDELREEWLQYIDSL
ncbi:Proteasome subunit beta type-3 [Castilleja foliolosa]|uniref:Proteasome subunit beta type-3 n=1 Tax=Castilleja foliolosa TaxID=1961234 RepID=A0ABD3B885_9LAMI